MSTRESLGRLAGLFALSGALISAGPVFGQGATAQTSTDQGSTDQTTTAQTGAPGDQLQEVVVTAERRATDIMATPVSIVAVSGDQLRSSQIVDTNSLGQVAPSLLILNTGINSTADIRGVGFSSQGGDEQPGVAILRDGLPNPTGGTGNIPYFDIADVEVLRGPQGTFSAGNSTGGAININSANPNFNGVGGYVDTQAATYSEQRLQGAVNLPVSDTLALRLAFNEETRGSFFRDEATLINGPYEGGPSIAASGPIGGAPAGNKPSSADEATYDPGNVDDKDLRLSVLWKPTDAFQMLTKIEFDNEDSQGIPTQPNTNTFSPLGPGLPCPAGDGTAPNCHNVYAPGYSGSPYELNNWASSMMKDDVESSEYSEEARYTLPSGIVLRALGGVQEIRQDWVSSTSNDSLNVGSYAQTIYPTSIYSGEVTATSPTTGPFSWITGASMYYARTMWLNYSVNVAAPYSPSDPLIGDWIDGSDYRWVQHAVFGQVSWQFTPTLQVVAGGRMTWDATFAVCNAAVQCKEDGNIYETESYAPGIQYLASNDGTAPSDRVPTGKVDLNWTPLPGQLFYAFVARGFKPSESSAGGTAAPPHYEWVTDYETGWKGKLVDNHLNVQLDGYYMQYEDMIHQTFNPENPTSTSTGNIPSSILKGIEFTLNANVGHLGLDLNAADDKSILGPFSIAAKYKFPSNTFFGTTPQCAPGVAPTNTATGCSDYTGSYPGDPSYFVNLNGEALPFAPQYTMNATIRYSIPVGNTYVVPRVQYSYRGKAYSDIFQSDNYYLLPGYSLVSAYLDWEAGPWTATIYGTNLANNVYQEGTGLYGDPRQLGLEVRRSF